MVGMYVEDLDIEDTTIADDGVWEVFSGAPSRVTLSPALLLTLCVHFFLEARHALHADPLERRFVIFVCWVAVVFNIRMGYELN